jgi:hypothetical protein
VLQTRKFSQETTSRDLFIKALDSIPTQDYLPLHPCAITVREPTWTVSATNFEDLLETTTGNPQLDYVLELCTKVMQAPGKEKEKLNLKKLFCKEFSSKPKGKIEKMLYTRWATNIDSPYSHPELDMNPQSNPALRKVIGIDFDVGHRQQKLFLWVYFCQHILHAMHAGEKPLTVQLLLQRTLKMTTLPDATKENIDLAILATLQKVVEKGSLTYVKASEVTKTNNPLYTLGGLFVDYCYSQEDVSNLQSIFNRLPVGVGDYEAQYIKPEGYSPPDNLPLQAGPVDGESIKFLADLFYSCTVPICKAVEDIVARGLERYFSKRNKTFQKAAFPTKKMNTILYPAVCSSWLKVLLKTGTMIFPTAYLHNVPGKLFCRAEYTISFPWFSPNIWNLLPFFSDYSHNVKISSRRCDSDSISYTNLPELAEFIVHILKVQSGLMVSEEYIQYLVDKLPTHFFVKEDLIPRDSFVVDGEDGEPTGESGPRGDTWEAAAPSSVEDKDDIDEDDIDGEAEGEPHDVYGAFRAPPLKFGFLQFMDPTDRMDEDQDEENDEDEDEDEDELEEDLTEEAYEKGLPKASFTYDELVDSLFRPASSDKFKTGEYKKRFRCRRNDKDRPEAEETEEAYQNRIHDKDGFDELIKQVNKKVYEYVKDGKCGAKRNYLQNTAETPQNRAAEVATYLNTVAHVSSFQHAKRAHTRITTVNDEVYAENYNKLLKGTFKLLHPPKKTSQHSLCHRATDPTHHMTCYGLVNKGSDDLSSHYRDLFTKVMDADSNYNTAYFEPTKGTPASIGYSGSWDLDSFDHMMTKLVGDETACLQLRCPSVWRDLSTLMRPLPVQPAATMQPAARMHVRTKFPFPPVPQTHVRLSPPELPDFNLCSPSGDPSGSPS